ncbi:MAG: helix-turn-helix domain-containing protein [Phycisphaerales bacterium]
MAELPNRPGAVPSTPLALRPRGAAKALGIGERKLWELSQPRGPIPCVRVGVCVLYPVAALQAWLSAEAAKGGQAQ